MADVYRAAVRVVRAYNYPSSGIVSYGGLFRIASTYLVTVSLI